MKDTFRIVLTFAVLTLAGCAPYRSGGFQFRRFEEEALQKKVVSLADYTPFEWDRVYVFNGYWSPSQVQNEIGSSLWFPSIAYRGGEADADWLMVFTLKGRVQAMVRDSSVRYSVVIAPDKYLTRENAKLVSSLPNADGWFIIGRMTK